MNDQPVEELLADLRDAVRAQRLDHSETPRADLIKKRMDHRKKAEDAALRKSKGKLGK